MSQPNEGDNAGTRFAWGRKKGPPTPRGTQFYWSFSLEGTRYCLYDCVLLFEEGDQLAHIGKLIKIWESAEGQKKVKVLWFLRPREEVGEHLADVVVFKKELFLACGEGIGVTDIFPVETVGGKCNVCCISKDKRNPQFSKEEQAKADYIFYRTFDVVSCRISDKIDDEIAGIKAEFLLNREKQKPDISRRSVPSTDKPSGIGDSVSDNQLSPLKKQKVSVVPLEPRQLMKTESRRLMSLDEKISSSTRKVDDIPVIRQNERSLVLGEGASTKVQSEKEPGISSADCLKDSPLTLNGNPSFHLKEGKGPKSFPDVDRKKKWFAERPWEVKMVNACRQERLVVLDNLDISYSAAEIEEAVGDIFNQKCDVRLVEQSAFTNHNHGQALVIFKSTDVANSVVRSVQSNLFLLNGRPLLMRKGLPRSPEATSSALRGLISLKDFEKVRRHQEQRSAVAGSHYSQPNTMEYEMAIEWMLLAHKFKCYWEQLHEEHEQEIKEIGDCLVDQ